MKLTIKQRWIKSRPGSVLILVIALLVLLALIGTAYLSSTQTERYTSHQNSINTQADLLIQGMANSVSAQIVNGLFGNNGTGVSQYRPVYPDAAATIQSQYYSYDAIGTYQAGATNTTADADPCDLWLADRVPGLQWLPQGSGSNLLPFWGNVSWPLFKDPGGENTFDSPLASETSLHLGIGSQKGNFIFQPTSETLGDGSVVPAMYVYSVTPHSYTAVNTNAATPVSGYPLNTGGTTNPDNTTFPGAQTIIAASASGDGIADSLLCKVPVGPINGITYYVATRIIDNNSAINASSAWSQATDFVPGSTTTPTPGAYPQQTTYATGGNAGAPGNQGFFRGNIGLYELLDTLSPTPYKPDGEISSLNTYRFGFGAYGPAVSSSSQAQLYNSPVTADSNNPAVAPTNFNWFSQCDAMDNLLAARPGNPGRVLATAQGPGVNTPASSRMSWLGVQASAALAYKFSLRNPLLPASPLEGSLYNELEYYAPSSPYSPNQSVNWYNNLFAQFNASAYTGFNDSYGASSLSPAYPACPLRTILTGNNAVTNSVPSLLTNSSATGTPTAWSNTTNYAFGDWVMGSDKRTYVCLVPNGPAAAAPNVTGAAAPNIQDPVAGGYATSTLTGTGTVEYWAYVPWTQQATKTNVNTASFEQLYLGFAQMMADPTPNMIKGEWTPPTQGGATIPQFGNVIGRNPAAPGGAGVMYPAQMLKLRAALAAAQTINMRSGTDSGIATAGAIPTNTHNVLSRRIYIEDPTGGANNFEVEVFGTKPGPYISEMVAQIDSDSANNYIAIELVNPYTQPLTLKNWALCTVDRSSFGTTAGMTMSPAMTVSDVGGAPATIVIPAATKNAATGIITPGVAVIASSATIPPKPAPALTIGGTATFYCLGPTGLVNAIGKELYLMRPRSYDGSNNNLGTVATGSDPYTEDLNTNTADLVPVDQLDLSGADKIPGTLTAADLPVRLQYRRGSLPPVTTGAGATLTTTPSYAWNFIYPGPYVYSNVTASGPASPSMLRSTGIIVQTASGNAGTASVPKLGGDNLGLPDGGAVDATGGNAAACTYNTAPLEIANLFSAGPNPLNYSNATVANAYPFGQFARNLDMLQIPFIGSYRIRTTSQKSTNAFTEMNSLTMDSELAIDTSIKTTLAAAQATNATSDTTPYSGFYEQIGRFCPVGDPTAGTGDFAPATQSGQWHYHWAEKLLNYFTVRAPHDDYYPNVDPGGTTAAMPLTPTGVALTAPLPDVTHYPGTVAPVAIANNDTATINAITAGTSEDTAGVEGLININTAPAPVLAQLPFFACASQTSTAGVSQSYLTIAQQRLLNARLAEAIVAYRTANGPFKSIFDLYKVPNLTLPPNPSPQTPIPGFFNTVLSQDSTASAANLLPITNPNQAKPPSPVNGVFVPGGLPVYPVPATPYATDSLRFDYKERFMLLNNISNLITTRSDTFTCYILLQGWRNVGTNNPTLAVQRRAAFILDRNGITAGNNVPLLFKVPTD